MLTFQGFKVIGIDRNKSPDFTSDVDMFFSRLYFLLEPIDGCAGVEGRRVWEFSFRWMIRNWETNEDFNLYKETIKKVPQLTFILDDNDNAVICAEGCSFRHLIDCIDFILLLVKHANSKFISWTATINRFREEIDAINSKYFGN